MPLHPVPFSQHGLIANREFDGKDDLDALGGVRGVAEKVKTDPVNGLDGNAADDLVARRAAFGENVMSVKPPKSYLELVWEALQDFIIIVLMISAVISLVLGLTLEADKEGSWIEGVAILVSVVVVSNVAAASDYGKNKKLREQQALLADVVVTVVRNGNDQTQIPIAELCVGDVVVLKVCG